MSSTRKAEQMTAATSAKEGQFFRRHRLVACLVSRSDLLLFGSVTDVTINSDSIIKLIGPNSEDNHVNVDDLNTEHIFYPRSSSSSESPDSLSFTSANRVG